MDDTVFERVDTRQSFGLLVEELGEVMRDHGGAGAGGDHDEWRGFERIEEVARHRAGFGPISRVEGRLAAAGLALREIDLEAEAFENISHGEADLGEKLIDDTSN